jgi:ferric-dicitrate binding protein FerR (iron transport regulator)
LFSSEAQPAGEQQLGRILYSKDTSLRGVAVPKSETILNGDVLATSNSGSAIVKLKSGAKLKITGNTSVRFLGDGDKVQAELLGGAVVSESAGKPAIVVTTSKFQFGPSQEGNSRFAVALSKQEETVASAMTGNLLVRTPGSHGSYILPEGKYAAIPATSDGVPAQEKAGGEQATAGQVGTVTNEIPAEVLQRQGQGAEIPLKVGDGVNQEDLVRTLKTGRVRITLQDGTLLNIGALSVLRITKQDPQAQQTQIELTQGILRAEVVKLTKPGGSFQVRTPTAIVDVVGTVLFVHALPDVTQVSCVEGVCLVQNINPTVAGQTALHANGQVTLQAGQSTTVRRGQLPTDPTTTADAQLQSEINQTNAGTPGGLAQAGLSVWHIGPLSEAESVLVLVGIGAAAAIAIPLATAGSASGTVPSH